MLAYISQRLASAAATVLLVAGVVFIVMNVLPGDPAARILGEEATPEQLLELREQLGLNRPLIVRLGEWYWDLLRGDLGMSLFDAQPVSTIIAGRAEPTILLTLLAGAIALLLGVFLGTVAALRAGSTIDLLTMASALVGVAIPHFWLGLNMILVFALYLRWLPTAGYMSLDAIGARALSFLVLPSVTLGFSHMAVIARMTRANLLEVLREDYLRTARAKGLDERVVINRHALRNAMIPTLGTIGVTIALLLAGAVVTETVFAIPGVGSLVVTSILRRDFPVIQGVLLTIALVTAVVNLAIDIAYGFVDPRITYS